MQPRIPRRFVRPLSIFATSLIPATALAQPADSKPAADGADLPQVEIIATPIVGYRASDASSATRTSASLKETPVTVQVVDETLIRDRGFRSPNELADVVAGVQPVVGYGAATSQYFIIRGFSNLGVNYRNGFRLAEVYTPRDLANVERVEFVKGPASVLYGAAQPGGAVNTVTKRPVDGDFLRARLEGGSYSNVRGEVDLNREAGPFGVRLNLAADRGNSYIEAESSRNALVAPVFSWKPSEGTVLLYEGEFQRTTRKGWSNGLLQIPGIEDLSFGLTLAEPWADFENTNIAHRLDFSTAINEAWSFRQGVYDARSRRSHHSVSPSFSADPLADGNSLDAVGRVLYNQYKDDPTNTVSQTEVIGRLKVGQVSHELIAGFEASKAVFEFIGTYDFLDTVDIRTFRPGSTPRPADGPGSGSRRSARSNALYLQDQVSMGNWRLLAGVRHERVKSRSVSLPDGAADAQEESATTSRLGVLYRFSDATSAYYSFSQSFTPNTGARSADGSLFDAERGTQHEVGIKHTLLPGVEATASLFDIRKRNVVVGDPNDPLNSIANGEQRSRGWEASVVGQLSPTLRLVGNVAQVDAKVTRDPAQQGARLFGVPKVSGNLWGVYTLPANVELGLGVVRVGEREAAQPGLDYFKLPAYTRLDASVSAKVGGVKVSLNVDNVTNEKILNSLEGFALHIEAPRNWTLSVGMEF